MFDLVKSPRLKCTPSASRSHAGSMRAVSLLLAAVPFTANAGILDSMIVRVTDVITAIKAMPAIAGQPVAVTVNAGQTATFQVTVKSSTLVSYQWMRNGNKILGATSNVYAISSTVTNDSGAKYSVAVQNAAGLVTSAAAQLTVRPATIVVAPAPIPVPAPAPAPTPTAAPAPTPTQPAAPAPAPATGPASAPPSAAVVTTPVITAQPQSTVVSGGQAATFAVTATSTGAMTYQWSRAGTPIVGATSASYSMATTQLADSGASFTVAVANAGGTTASAAARLTVNAVVAQAANAAKPFSAQSPWNARPTHFTLGTYQVPTSNYYPAIESGEYSVAAAVASPSDPAMTVMGPDAGSWLYVADAEAAVAQIVIPHWPANMTPATGSDGHADIIDVAANKIHSFWQLHKVGSQWRAVQYTWTALDGSGWGTPASYLQGSRAAGVPTIAGLIRKAEIDDGQPSYKHALAMSMTYNGLAASPSYTFPATTSDDATSNTGAIPEGALMMLPDTFDSSQITDPRLAKIVATLKSFGAYVVDRNGGAPFAIYLEMGSNFNLMPNGWDNSIASQLDSIRSALRQVTQVSEWVDASGTAFTPNKNLNLLSMRGAWWLVQGGTAGVFDTWQQAVVFPNSGQQVVQTNFTGRSMPSIVTNPPRAGQLVRMSVHATGGASILLELANTAPQFSSGFLSDGAEVTFAWPVGQATPHVTVKSGPLGGGTISATVVVIGS